MHGYTELRLGALDDVRITVAAYEGATLLSLVADALGGRGHGLPVKWRRLVRSAAPASAPEVLGPLFTPEYSVIPDCVTPTACVPDGDVATQCEYLAGLSPDTLLRELEAEFGGRVPRQWRSVIDRPRKWIGAYTDLLSSVWREFRPVWKRAAGLLERETERVGVAVVRGRPDAILQGISGRFRLLGASLHLPDPQSDTYDLAGRRLVLVPIVSGAGASMFALDLPDQVWIGYPLPGVGRLWGDAPRPPAADRLAVVLGPLRATILRSAGHPLSMSELAGVLACSPANATYHCRSLVEAGLLERRRHGKHVIITRTEAGDAFTDLLG
ncbi:MAG TPA: winged helix-turn-helix domain-containing protein [Streptosporangiaceae bacterium]|jgi:hypothetical protein